MHFVTIASHKITTQRTVLISRWWCWHKYRQSTTKRRTMRIYYHGAQPKPSTHISKVFICTANCAQLFYLSNVGFENLVHNEYFPSNAMSVIILQDRKLLTWSCDATILPAAKKLLFMRRTTCTICSYPWPATTTHLVCAYKWHKVFRHLSSEAVLQHTHMRNPGP